MQLLQSSAQLPTAHAVPGLQWESAVHVALAQVLVSTQQPSMHVQPEQPAHVSSPRQSESTEQLTGGTRWMGSDPHSPGENGGGSAGGDGGASAFVGPSPMPPDAPSPKVVGGGDGGGGGGELRSDTESSPPASPSTTDPPP